MTGKMMLEALGEVVRVRDARIKSAEEDDRRVWCELSVECEELTEFFIRDHAAEIRHDALRLKALEQAMEDGNKAAGFDVGWWINKRADEIMRELEKGNAY